MQLRYTDRDGLTRSYELGDEPMTIGRASDADIVIDDERASRYHCGIRFWDGDYVLKDLRSRNGTFVNEKPAQVVQLQPGDQVRIGATVFHFESPPACGTDTAIREIAHEMEEGKGYSTILREIVGAAEQKNKPAPPPAGGDAATKH